MTSNRSLRHFLHLPDLDSENAMEETNFQPGINPNPLTVPHNPSRNSSVSSQYTADPVQHLTLDPSLSSTSTRVRYGSQREETDRLGASLREIQEEDARFVYVNDPDRTNEKFEFTGNSIKTGKYSILTFLPRNLFEQFHRIAYIYFLIIAILNQLPVLAVFGKVASFLFLTFVLLVTAIKDAYEDWRRHRADRIENNRMANVLVNKKFEQKRWKDIRVGEIIKISVNETLPCDVVLLSTSDSTGVAYVQTINLDGESNLKTRYAKQETLLMAPEKEVIDISIRCEKPSRNIYGFLANMDVDGKKVSLGTSNILLRGCDLKNTDWAIGVVVYAGQETKVMLNSSGSPSKQSRLETHMNRETILLSIFLVILCSIVSTLCGIWLWQHGEELDSLPFYRRKDFNYHGLKKEIVFAFLQSVIVFQIMIPLSLYISMELVRLGQAYFMTQDKNLYHEASKSLLQCRALNINEDLGQIKYVFSDKTGTLTENKMEFQCASIQGIDYSNDESHFNIDRDDDPNIVGNQVLRAKMIVKTNPELVQLLKSEGSDRGHHVRNFFLALASCNTIVPLVNSEQSVVEYQGESPDEQALVYAAAAYGYMLVERTSGHIVIDILGQRQRFDILGMHEFDSERKRMSVIVGSPDKSIKLFVKGADSSMFSVTNKSSNEALVCVTESHLHSYSTLGLRTLVVGMRELSSSEFETWQSAYYRANASLLGRARLLRSVASDIECNIGILGATGIEDKLQQGVPEAIESLQKAGIKVWVLTGDKQETAISIGFSCKLLTDNMIQIVINTNSKDSCQRKLADEKKKVSSLTSNDGGENGKRQAALIIDGTSLVDILESDLETELFELATACSVVLCCRVAPLQKAGIVAVIKNRTNDMTLAIGDGANDVSMIQMADVGIGISGQEGRQAVMASDFAMGQFRFLVPLLLVHGHWNYQRMAYMILYNFYRNAAFVLILFWYVLFTAFSLTNAITEWSSVLFSVIYTSVPTIVVGILDKDLNRKTLLKYPQLYGAGPRQESYNFWLFIVTMVDTLWQSAVIFYVPYFVYRHSTIDTSSIGDIWTLAVVILVNLHLAMDIGWWNWIVHAAIWGSIIATTICLMVIDAIEFLPGYWAIFDVASTGVFWLSLLCILIVGVIPRFVVKVFIQYWFPSDIQIAKEAEKFKDYQKTRSIELNQILERTS